MAKTNRTAQYQQISSNLSSPNDVYRSVRVNGRYVTPWGGQRPSLKSVLRWGLFVKNERGIGGELKDCYKYKTEVILNWNF